MAAILMFDSGGWLSGDQIPVYDGLVAEGVAHGPAFWQAARSPRHRVELPAAAVAEAVTIQASAPSLKKISGWVRFKAKFGF